MTRVTSNPFTIQVQGASGQTGLNFPSNGDSPSSAFVAFQFLNPHLNGLPIWGPNGQGTTFIWKIRSRPTRTWYADFQRLVTSQGQANIWWKKINPTPDNLLCEAGTGRNPVWAQSTRATLWTG